MNTGPSRSRRLGSLVFVVHITGIVAFVGPARAGTVSGRVEDASRNPVPRARVTLFDDTLEIFFEARTELKIEGKTLFFWDFSAVRRLFNVKLHQNQLKYISHVP